MRHSSNYVEHYQGEVFQGGASESEMLSGILFWWEKEYPKYAQANLDNISITWDDEGCYAEVLWHWITIESLDAIAKSLTEEIPVVINTEQLSGN